MAHRLSKSAVVRIAVLPLLVGFFAPRFARALIVIHVDVQAPPAGTGLTWKTAFNDLQDALVLARTPLGDAVEVWVARGVYRPDRGTTNRNDSFALVNSVGIYGGFIGNETSRDARNPVSNPTILSGDLSSNDGPESANNQENSIHVVTAANAGDTTILDGFTIVGGNADASSPNNNGGGAYISGGRPVIAHCTFSGNSAARYGGAVATGGFTLASLTGCDFVGNRAQRGGGLSGESALPRLTACSFTGNSCTQYGGAIYITTGSLILADCRFSFNSTPSFGGALATNNATTSAVNCVFTENEAGAGGGAIQAWTTLQTIQNCAFSGNVASQAGGAVVTGVRPTSLTNCTFTGNAAATGGAVYVTTYGDVAVQTCTIYGNSATDAGGGVFVEPASQTTIDTSILWGNAVAGEVDEFTQVCGGQAVVRYSCLQGLYERPAEPDVLIYQSRCLGNLLRISVENGNIAANPMLVDMEGADGLLGTEDDDPRLTRDSPCANRGNPALVPPPGATDIEGRPRLQGTRVDLGAFETQTVPPPGDFNADGRVDLLDVSSFQVCYVSAVSVPDWTSACLRVYDFDASGSLDLQDFRRLHLNIEQFGSGIGGPP